jgi:glucose/mannose-6-phosphate isomerase
MMNQLIEKFPEQLISALDIGKKVKHEKRVNAYTQVVVSGLGGSGIGASIVQEYVYDKLKIPFIVNKEYFIPASVNKSTLFIACSYSGNTEETIHSVQLAKKAGAHIVCITSGGQLEQFALKNKFNLYLIPNGMPPRACLGYSLVQILFSLKNAGLLKTSFEKEIQGAIQLLQKLTKTIRQRGKKLAAQLFNKQIAIYTVAGREALAIRFRQQLNENSKVLCWHNVIPEMTHNEIVGWRINKPDVCTVYCYSKSDYSRNLTRMGILQKVTKSCQATQAQLIIEGNNFWEQCFYFIHFTDWVSVELAELYHHDAVEVKVIDHLKNQLSKK